MKKIYLATFLVFLLCCFFSEGYHHFDEHFQILEFAGSRLNITTADDLPWEFHHQMRSTIQPTIAIAVYKLMQIIGVSDPFLVALMLRILSALLAFSTIWLLYKNFSKEITDIKLKSWFILFSFFLWFVIYNGVRFSSENWSGALFSVAFSLFFLVKNRSSTFYFLVGVVLGLSFLFKYQAGLLITGFMSWIIFVKKEKMLNTSFLISGIICMFILGILVDKWFYGEWTITAWNYFNQNLLLDKVSSFGTEPWWWYIQKFIIQGAPPLSIIFTISLFILITFKTRSPITWSLLPFLIFHFIVGHKELRFLFPIIYFLPIILIKAIEIIQLRFISRFASKKYLRIIITICLVVNFIFLSIVIFRPADHQIALYRSIYRNYKNPTNLYYISKNPYMRVLDIKFYKRNNLEIKRFDMDKKMNLQNDSTSLIVYTHKNHPKEVNENHKLVYCTFPKWITKFNFNNWLDRTSSWYVYELENRKTLLK